MPPARDRLVYSTQGGQAPKPMRDKGPDANRPPSELDVSIRRE